MRTFDAPNESPVLISLAKLLLPALMRIRHGDLRLEIAGDGLKRFKDLQGKRVLICPNHPSEDDSDIVFALSRAVGETFNFLTAWELFHGRGGRQKWLQYMGCFSIARGAADYASFKACRDLLVKGQRKIVIFPEGEISHNNDLLLPVKPGAVQISFAALEKLEKMKRLEPILILPVALKYVYRCDIGDALNSAVQRLEEALSLAADGQNSLYDRIRRIGLTVLSALESEYNFTPARELSLNERIAGLRATILRQAAAALQVELPAGGTQLEWAHLLQNVLYDLRYGTNEEGEGVLKELSHDRSQQLRSLTKDLHRVINFIAIYKGYIRDPATQEQLASIVGLLEQEVLGTVSNKGPRSALVAIREPINLLDFYESYKQNRAVTVHGLVHQLTSELSSGLLELDANRQPVYINRLPEHCRS